MLQVDAMMVTVYSNILTIFYNVDDNTVELFLSIMSRILKSSTTIESATREMLIMKYHKICRELLDPKDQSKPCALKMGSLNLLMNMSSNFCQQGNVQNWTSASVEHCIRSRVATRAV